MATDNGEVNEAVENAAGEAKPVTKTPVTVGRLVLYKLSQQDADEINRRRDGFQEEGWPLTAQRHVGNRAYEGDTLPCLVVTVHSDECFNGQVFLDGNDSLWVTSTIKGETPGTWDWMPFQKDQQARLAAGTQNDSHPAA